VGRGWPSLATQAIGEKGSPRWKHPGVPGAEAGTRMPDWETFDRICKLYGLPQTFVK
jgi:hypothetical protein